MSHDYNSKEYKEEMMEKARSRHEEREKAKKEKKKQDPRYLEYQRLKAIPFSFHLGFSTLSVESAVLEKIKKHWLQNTTEDKGDERVAGICFGRKKGTQIEIEEYFEFEYGTDEDIIPDGRFYKTDSEFLGIYSNGTIPDEEDVSILQKFFRDMKRSVFLIKFRWSPELNKIRIVVFENAFDIKTTDWQKRLISVQISKHPSNEGTISKNDECDDDSKKMFYFSSILFYYASERFELDLNDDQKLKLKEIEGTYKYRSSSELDAYPFLYKLAEEEGWKYYDFLDFDPQKDYVKMAKKLYKKANIELRFAFFINLKGEESFDYSFYEDYYKSSGTATEYYAFKYIQSIRCVCKVSYLCHSTFGIGECIEESYQMATSHFIRNVLIYPLKVEARLRQEALKKKEAENEGEEKVKEAMKESEKQEEPEKPINPRKSRL